MTSFVPVPQMEPRQICARGTRLSKFEQTHTYKKNINIAVRMKQMITRHGAIIYFTFDVFVIARWYDDVRANLELELVVHFKLTRVETGRAYLQISERMISVLFLHGSAKHAVKQTNSNKFKSLHTQN